MGRKKSVIKIPLQVIIKCPFCENKMKIKVPANSSVHSLECKKCKQMIQTPITKCCLICAFSNKKCPDELLQEAHAKGLEIR